MLQALPFNEFLPTDSAYNKLVSFNTETILKEIPRGPKNNSFFLVDNSENLARMHQNISKIFVDDCGSWNKTNFTTGYYIKEEDGNLKSIVKYKGKFCKAVRAGRKKIYKPYEKQPTEVIALNKYYCKHKSDNSYQRRIVWLTDIPLALVEYKGIFPGHIPHGNAKNKQVYIRSSEELIQNILKKCEFVPGKQLYDDLQNADNSTDLPRNPQQIYNMKYHHKNRKETPYRSNFADEVLEVINISRDSNFIKKIVHLKDQSISVVLFTNDQINDVRRFCCSGASVLGVDKTYNLGKMFVTATVFKNTSLISVKSSDHPIFLGPIFLHSKSNILTYKEFFGFLKEYLKSTEKLICGSDDEAAIHKSLVENFPGCTHLLCTKHLKENLIRYIRDKIGVNRTIRNCIVNKVFDLLNSKNIEEYELKEKKCLIYCQLKSSQLVSYLQGRFLPLLKEKVWNHIQVAGIWTNNNCESMNNVLKSAADWKQLKLPNLINMLEKVVNSLYIDMKKAIYSTGPYMLSTDYKNFQVTLYAWQEKNEQEKEQHYKKLMSKNPRLGSNQSKFVLSTNKKLLVQPPAQSAGRKQNQSKRKRAERTTTQKQKIING